MPLQKYDFDQPVDRRGTGSLKWDVAPGELPMWLADMDFRTAPEVLVALEERVRHGVFGYTDVPCEWRDAYRNWWATRHDLQMDPGWLVFCTGVVPALSSMVRKLTTVGENVLIQSPVYNIFYNSIRNNGRHILESPLRYADGGYTMDLADLEDKLADPQTSLMILCNPHNPVGRIWDRETLATLGEMCLRHGVTVISDEIHCDLTAPGTRYVPFASVSEACRNNSVTCVAPTKAFNLAGLQTAAVMVPDNQLRHRVWRALNTDEVAEPGAFAAGAAIAAFNHGGPWLDALRAYLFANRQEAQTFLTTKTPGVFPVPAEATFLLWLDCRAVSPDSGRLSRFLRAETGLYLTDGAEYGRGGEGFLRLNLACPRVVLKDGLRRLEAGVAAFRN